MSKKLVQYVSEFFLALALVLLWQNFAPTAAAAGVLESCTEGFAPPCIQQAATIFEAPRATEDGEEVVVGDLMLRQSYYGDKMWEARVLPMLKAIQQHYAAGGRGDILEFLEVLQESKDGRRVTLHVYSVEKNPQTIYED